MEQIDLKESDYKKKRVVKSSVSSSLISCDHDLNFRLSLELLDSIEKSLRLLSKAPEQHWQPSELLTVNRAHSIIAQRANKC
jgi:hypothetical protein